MKPDAQPSSEKLLVFAGRWIPGFLGALVIAALVLAARAHSAPPPARAGGRARALPVRTSHPEPAAGYVRRREFTGEVRARRKADLGFERAGRLVELLVDEGDAVDAGRVLARLDARKLAADRKVLVAQQREAEAVLAEMRAGPRVETVAAAEEVAQELRVELELLEKKLERRATLLRERTISDEEYDEVQARLLAVRARLRAAEDRLEALKEGTRAERILAQEARRDALLARIARLDLELSDAELVAPFAGRVLHRSVDEGTVVVPGRAVVTLVEDSALEVWIGVAPQVARSLAHRDHHRVRVGDVTFEATLAARLPTIDARTRTQPVVLALPAHAAEHVVPGQVARLTTEAHVEAAGAWVPASALVRGVRGLWAIYAVELDGEGGHRVVRHHVEVLHTGGERVFVRGTLGADAELVVGNTERIAPGQAVEPMAGES